jgi:Tol biopolymer transport system component
VGRISPDRRTLLFYRTPKGIHDRDFTQTSLWTIDLATGATRQLRAVGTDGWSLQGHAEWSPDGRHLIMFGGKRSNPQIYVTNADGTLPRAVTTRGGSNLDPSWSPDGRSVVFVGCPQSFCLPASYELYTIDIEGKSAPHRLTSDRIRDQDPYFAPNGREIAWLSQTGTAGVAGRWGIRLAAIDGSLQRTVIDDGQINSKPEWSRDGRTIYFHRLVIRNGSKFGIWAIDVDGTHLRKITVGPGNNEYPSN